MSSTQHRLIFILILLGSLPPLRAQATDQAQPSQAEQKSIEEVQRVPGPGGIFRGLNAGLTFSGVHDSSIGWYDVATPGISYTYSPHYWADVSFSIYPYRLAQNPNTTAPPSQRLVTTHGDLGDTLMEVHAYFSPRELQNTITAALTAPTGNRVDGLGTGRVTFDFRDHIERYVHRNGFILDLGMGDSSGLFNRLVMDQDSRLGPIAHFQTGSIYWLPGHNYIESVAYEQLPIGDQKIYNTATPPGMPPKTVVVGRGVSEDNGFTTSVGIPLTSRITLSSYYNRSLRLHLDTVSVGVTFVLRGTGWKKEMSMIDRAIREAEGANP